MFSLSSELKVPDLSDNFLVRNGIFFTKKEYFRNHIKIIDNKNLVWLRKYLLEMLGEKVEPFIMTNRGNLIVYFEERDQIGYYHIQENFADIVFDLRNNDIDWVLDVYLVKKALQPLFDKDLFRFNIEYNEIFVLPFYAEDTKYNYKPVKVDVAYELYRQGF